MFWRYIYLDRFLFVPCFNGTKGETRIKRHDEMIYNMGFIYWKNRINQMTLRADMIFSCLLFLYRE